jgi:enoyl-CoA hydratase
MMGIPNFEFLIVEIEDAISTITINRPDKLNALNEKVKLELLEALDGLEDNSNVKIIILAGSGEKSFIAGDDIQEFEKRNKEDFTLLQKLTLKIENLKKIVIASINGYTLGGGLEIVLACDFRVASKNSKFGLPEIELGLIPGAGGTQRLPRVVGISRAKKMILLGKPIDSQTAYEYGLIDILVETGDLEKVSRELAITLCEKSSIALELGKKAINYSVDHDIKSGLNKELDFVWHLKNTSESKRRVETFLNKKKG